MVDPDGRTVGATFLRNNLNKRSVAIDLKHPEGRELFLSLVPRFDVVCENFKAGTMDRLGLGYDVIAERHPAAIYLSLSGFGNTVETPYRSWPAYASIVEAMSGIYEYKRGRAGRPRPTRSGPWATSARRCSGPSACSPPCGTATAPATASRSTSPCSTPSWP